MIAKVDVSNLKLIGSASCLGGKHPDPPLHGMPLLGWQVWHEKHGNQVFTEDGAASVQDIAIAACETPNYEALASRFGTTPDHVSQAVEYAVRAKFLG